MTLLLICTNNLHVSPKTIIVFRLKQVSCRQSQLNIVLASRVAARIRINKVAMKELFYVPNWNMAHFSTKVISLRKLPLMNRE